jgi:hypothetical protein
MSVALAEFSQQPLRFLLPSNHLSRYSPLAIKLMAFGELALIQSSKGSTGAGKQGAQVD